MKHEKWRIKKKLKYIVLYINQWNTKWWVFSFLIIAKTIKFKMIKEEDQTM